MAKTIDFGVCDQCGERNSKTLKICRACQVDLPWAKPAKTKSDKPKTQYSIPPLQIIGGLVFALGVVLWCGNVIGFFPTFPGAGYLGLVIGGALFKAGWDA